MVLVEPYGATSSRLILAMLGAMAAVQPTYLQFGGSEWNISDCKERALAAYTAAGHKAAGVKKLEIYIKPEEGKAYYVINEAENPIHKEPKKIRQFMDKLNKDLSEKVDFLPVSV